MVGAPAARDTKPWMYMPVWDRCRQREDEFADIARAPLSDKEWEGWCGKQKNVSCAEDNFQGRFILACRRGARATGTESLVEVGWKACVDYQIWRATAPSPTPRR